MEIAHLWRGRLGHGAGTGELLWLRKQVELRAKMEQLLYIGHSIMIAYCNLHGGTGKPLWEITLGEYSIWFQVCCALSNKKNNC
jgi:hypothetical protein